MWARPALIVGSLIVLFLTFIVGLMSGFLMGLIMGNGEAYHRRFLEEQKVVAPLLADDAAFANVKFYKRSNGGIYLGGDVPTQDDLYRLRILVVRALGESRSQLAMNAVGLKK